jgi:hypothetical protein
MRFESFISSGQVRGVGFRACQVEVLRMNFRHVEENEGCFPSFGQVDVDLKS